MTQPTIVEVMKMAEEIKELHAELASRDDRIAELEAMINQSDFDKYLVSKMKNPQLAEEFARVRIADKTLHEIVEKQTNLILRLKEAGENLIQLANFKNKKAIEYIDAWSEIVEELESYDYDNHDFHKGG
jgi:hypothetical protein